MPEKIIPIGLSFTADTTKARQEMDKLKNDLSKIISSANIGQTNSTQFNQIINQAAQLRGILEKATTSAGRLDLSKFERSLKSANIDLNAMAREFQKIDGGQFFNNLAQQVMSADTKVNILSGTLKKFAQGLMNTAMWTIQSNAIHAVEGALSSAYNYAQKLNKGLTDIAIVSDLNTEQLTNFAKTANQMAKDLSASTSDVVSGALIYYQAGLSDEEVIKRTETTIKLAQTSGENAEQISSYMTAIWNNFYDGSKSVEYYADVISYLGAVTAASNADIAEGMQSFSAVAQTVGLDFEDAAAAMTLLRDVTQQSASTIGNSLKTIFARLSSLKMGETLEDGVTLTKYTKALESVGVEVLDANGELRDMSDIIRSLAEHWDSLGRAEKDALAQTVGGVRQYNNLITLMDHFEEFEELVAGSQGADGYLQNQADEYADSWEGARNRLQAAWEGIYDQLIDDKFMIKLTNFGTTIVNFISEIIKGAGGIKGVVAMVISAVSSFNPESFAQSLRNIKDTLLLIKDALTGVQTEANKTLQGNILDIYLNQNSSLLSVYNETEAYDALAKELAHVYDLRAMGREEEAKYYESLLARHLQEVLNLEEEAKKLEELQRQWESITEVADINKDKSDRFLQYAGLATKTSNAATGLSKDNNYIENAKNAITNNTYGKGITDKLREMLFGPNPEEEIKKYVEELKKTSEAAIHDLITSVQEHLEQGKYNKDGTSLLKILGLDEGAEQTQIQQKIQALVDDYASLGNAIETEASKGKEANEKHIEDLKAQRSLIEEIINRLLLMGDIDDEIKAKLLEIKNGAENRDHGEKVNTDWAAMTTSAIRAASAISRVSGGMDGLVQSIKEGNVSFGSLVGSFSSIVMGASSTVTALTAIQTKMTESGAIATFFGDQGGAILKFLTGPYGMFAVIAITAALKIIFGLIQSISDEIYKNSPEGKIEATTNALEKQKNIVNELASAYSNLESTISRVTGSYDKLQDAAEKYGIGSPQYLLALEEYNAQLDELADKYGEGIFSGTDNNGVRILDENALAGAQLAQLNTAKAYQQELQNSLNNQQKDLLEGRLLNSANASKYANSVNNNGNVTIGVDKNNNLIEMAEEDYDKVWKAIGDSIEAGQNDFSQVEELLKGLDEEAQNYFRKLLDPYFEALKTVDGNKDLSDLAQGVLSGQGVYTLGDKYKISEDKINEAINNYGNSQYEALKDDQATIDSAKFEWAKQQGYDYNSGTGAFTDANGQAVTEGIPEVADMVRAYIKASILSEFEDVNSDAIKTILQDAGLDPDVMGTFLQEMAQNAAEANRLADAQKDVATLGQDAERVENLKNQIDNLVDSEEDLEDAQKRFSDATKDNEGALTRLASAAIQTQEGFDELEKGINDWYEAINSDDPLAKADALMEMKDALADIINVSDEIAEGGVGLGEFFDDYIINNADVVQDALRGDRDAIEELQQAAAVDMVLQLDTTDMQMSMDEATNMMADQMNWIEELVANGDLRLGAVDNTELLASLTNTINALTTDVDIAQQILAKMGFNAKVKKAQTPAKVNKIWHPATYTETTVYDYGEPKKHSVLDSPGWWEEKPTQETITSLEIETADYVGGGNILGAVGGTPSGNDRAKNSSPKSNSNHGSERKTKDKDTQRYHEVTAQLKQNKAALDLVNKAKDRAFGSEKISGMKEEIELLKEQVTLYERLAQEANDYLEKDKAALLAIDSNIQFNADGTIKNFEAWYDSWVDRYNNGSVDDDWWKKFEDTIKKYETALDKVDEAEKARLDALYKIYDENLEIVITKVEFLNGLIEDEVDYLDYLIERLDDRMTETAKSVALMGNKAGEILKEVENTQNAIVEALTNEDNHELLSKHPELVDDLLNAETLEERQAAVQKVLENIGQLTDKEQKQLREWIKDLIKYAEQLDEIRKEMYESLGDAIEKFNDKIERQRDIIEDLDGLMNHYKNVIDIVGKDVLGISDEMLKNMSRMSVKAAKDSLQIVTAQLETNKAQLDDLYALQQQRLAEGLEEDARLVGIEIEKQEDVVRELSESWASSLEDAMDTAAEAFKTTIQIATDAFDKAVAGAAGTLDNLQDYFDKQTNLEDQFLPTYERIYQLSKLTRDVNNAIDNTDNIKGKQRLRDLQNEILQAQKEGTELSEYDVEFMQKRLELEIAQIAMEEARNAKNMVRMTRDSEGNWSYTYTQNPEEMERANQEYEDKLHDLEKLNQDHIKELQQQMIQAMQSYKDEIASLDMSDEERKNKLIDYWTQLQSIYGDAFGKALDDGDWITNGFGVYSHNLVDTFDETTFAMISGYKSLEDYMNNFAIASDKLNADTTASFTQWGNDYKTIMESAGTSVDDFKDKVKEDMGIVDKAMTDAVGNAKDLIDDLDTEVDEIINNLDDFASKYSGLIDGLVGENDKWYKSIHSLIEEYDKLKAKDQEEKKKEETKPKQEEQKSQTVDERHGCSCGATCTTTCWTDCGSNGASQASKPKSCGCGGNCSGNCKGGCDNTCNDTCKGFCVNTCKGCTGCGSDCVGKVVNLPGGWKPGFATGGYTGAWGDEGKFAMLHEKELVLNKEDTANMLATVGFVRDLVEMIGVNATSSGGIGNLLLGGVASGGNYLDQNVNIHAEFPNATNHSEIEEAFQNLIGLAGQYAGRKQ